MKKVVLVGLCIVSLIILTGGSYKTLVYKILNDYEEVCVDYQINVTADLEYCSDIPTKTCDNETEEGWIICYYDYNNTYKECVYSHRYIQTDNCIEYQLRRKTDIEPFINLFDWCEVYPDSDDCK